MNDQREVAAAISKRLAKGGIPDAAVTSFTKRLLEIDALPRTLDICAYGMCGDFWVKRDELFGLFDKLHANFDIREMRIFTKGIFGDPEFQVRFQAVLPK